MSAAALAKARREAILKSRGDRLAKLTSSARGDDHAGVYARDDSPSATQSSAREEKISPNTSNRQSSPQPPATDDIPPLSSWGSEEQQLLQQGFRDMLNGMANRETSQFSPFAEPNQAIPQVPEDPLSALFTSMMGQDSNTSVPPYVPVKPKTLLQRALPLFHLLCMIGLLVWFVLWREPEQFAATIKREGGEQVINVSKTSRWAGLSKESPVKLGLVVSPLPTFFWAFTTVELILHSIRLFTASDEYQPPMLLSLILPHLTPRLSQTITTSLKYFHMASLVLDDLAILLFGMAVIVYVSGWTT